MKIALNLALLAATMLAALPASANLALAQKNSCMACHAVDKKLVGPAYQDVAKMHAGQADATAKLMESIRKAGIGQWGQIPMPAQPAWCEADAKTLADWVLNGAK